jgi:quinol monooxygenase YgiN
MIYVIATLKAKAGMAGHIKQAALPLIAATRAEDGCMSYELSADIVDENRLVFVERWESRDQLEAHFTTPHIATFGQAVKELLGSQRVEIIESDTIEVI